jgi:putative hydrolase of the HAD superfamily
VDEVNVEARSRIRAAVFDLGGVVFDSPLAVIADYEQRKGLPQHFIGRVVGGYGGADGAWHQLERGELVVEAFCEQFDQDVRALGEVFDTAELMRELSLRAGIRPVMLQAIRKLREAGFTVGALTNNWVTDPGYDERLEPLRAEFHGFVESCKVGMRKPEPGIYELTCRTLGITPAETVFLDDMGPNLKAARALGMATIKVSDPVSALRELEGHVGISLGLPAA